MTLINLSHCLIIYYYTGPYLGMPIRVAERKIGIFKYPSLDMSFLFSGSLELSDSSSLWHKHLGYPSNFVLENFLGQSMLKHDLNQLCSICLRAKQTFDVFPSSNNNAIIVFDLIHCDL